MMSNCEKSKYAHSMTKARRSLPRSCRWRACSTFEKRSEEHTSELQSRLHLVCRLLLEKKKIPLDLRLALLQLALPSPAVLLGLAELRRGRRLRLALDRVRELGGSPDQVELVHPHGVTG